MFASGPLRRERGMSLIELMVGLVVAMLVALAAAGSAIFFTAIQRQGMGTNFATASTANALAAMKEDVSQAGLGFVSSPRYACKNLNLSRDTRLLPQHPFAPLHVASSGGFDELGVVYGSHVAAGSDVSLTAPSNTLSAELSSYMPVAVGDAVLFAPWPSPGTCTVRTVTAIEPASAGTPQRLTLAATGEHNQVSFAAPATYLIQDKLTLLGSLTWHRYRVADGNLVLEWPFEVRPSAVVLRDVVAFRVQYGTATAASATPTGAGPRNTTVTGWSDAADLGSVLDETSIERVRALRIGIVTRSAQPEKPAPDGTCSASAAEPEIFGVKVSLSGNWKCFRYRTATAMVPLRNLTSGLRR